MNGLPFKQRRGQSQAGVHSALLPLARAWSLGSALSLVALLVSNKSLSSFSGILIYCFSDNHHPALQFLKLLKTEIGREVRAVGPR